MILKSTIAILNERPNIVLGINNKASVMPEDCSISLHDGYKASRVLIAQVPVETLPPDLSLTCQRFTEGLAYEAFECTIEVAPIKRIIQVIESTLRSG